MLLVWILEPIIAFALFIVSQMPVADVSRLTAAVAPAARLVAWMRLLDEVAPVTELLGAVGILVSVYVAMYGVMLVRRTFSLFWPGAGS